eukprot:9643-Heterococcus_DN1.PRE.1
MLAMRQCAVPYSAVAGSNNGSALHDRRCIEYAAACNCDRYSLLYTIAFKCTASSSVAALRIAYTVCDCKSSSKLYRRYSNVECVYELHIGAQQLSKLVANTAAFHARWQWLCDLKKCYTVYLSC